MISVNCSVGVSSIGIIDPNGPGLGEANMLALELEPICMKIINSLRYADVSTKTGNPDKTLQNSKMTR